MFGLSSRKRGTIAIVDVGTGSAGVGILRLHDKEAAIMQASARVSLTFEDRTPQQSIAALSQAIKEAGGKAMSSYHSQKEHPAPDSLFIFLRIPWCRSKSMEAVKRFDEETLITDRVISQLAKEVLTAEKDIDTTNLLEATVMKIQLNGYHVADPKGKRAHSVAISVLLSDADLNAKANILEAVKSIFPSHVPQWRTHTRALMRVLGESSEEWRDCLVLDLGTESASVFVVRKGILLDQTIVQYGSRSILKAVSKRGMPEETMALLSLYERDQAGESTEQIRTQIAEAEPEMIQKFGERLSALASQKRLPNRLLLVAHPDLAAMLSRFFSKIDFAQFTVTNQPFSVLAVDSKHLERFIVAGNGAVPDPSISIAGAFVNIEESGQS